MSLTTTTPTAFPHSLKNANHGELILPFITTLP